MGARPWEVVSAQSLAQTLRARGRPGDAARAGALAAEGEKTASELGLLGLVGSVALSAAP